jgi:hypothetical protein
LRQMMDEMMDPSLLLNIKFLLVRIAHARLTVAADIPDNLIWQWIREVWDGSTVDCCNRLDLGLILVNLGQHVRVGSAEEELTARYLKELLEHPKGTQRQKMKLMLALANRHIKYGSAHVSQAEARHYLQSICGAAEADEAMRTAATQALGMLD